MVSVSAWLNHLVMPAIAAPMTAVSGTKLVNAARQYGIVGAFPTHNARTVDTLGQWLAEMRAGVANSTSQTAPFAPNLVVHPSNTRMEADLECIIEHGCQIVITSVGSPKAVVPRLHAAGCAVFADVATMRHVDRAISVGVDGLVLLGAGAGGQTGFANPFAFVRAVRERFDGIIVLAGGITDGTSILAAQVLGADLVYLGTRLIATTESLADEAYRSAVVEATLDDVRLSSVVGGIPANLLSSWLEQRGLASDSDSVATGFRQERLLRNQDVWSAGHGVDAIEEITSTHDVLTTIQRQYETARRQLFSTMDSPNNL